jgi:hypothetical protein
MEKKAKIVIKVDKNGAVTADMSNFNNCSKETRDIIQTLDLKSEKISYKEDENHEVSHITVKRK